MTLLEESRKEINAVDDELVKLFERRMKAVEGVIQYKMENHLPIFDSSREADNIARNCAKLTRPELKDYFEKWYQETMNISKEYQKSILQSHK